MLKTGFHIVQSNHPEAKYLQKIPKLKIVFTFQPGFSFNDLVMVLFYDS